MVGGLVACATAADDFEDGTTGAGASSTDGGAGQGGSGQGGAATGSSGATSTGNGMGGAGATTTGATTTGATTTGATTTGGGPAPGTIFFSEYVEGSGNNKALELYNAGPTPIALADCTITHYQNGATSGQPALSLANVMLGSEQTFVVCHTSFSNLGLCDQASASIQHSGNDAVVLSCGGQTKDVFGRIGQDAVWGTAPTVSQDATLRRKCSVVIGDSNGNDNFDPSLEWSGFPIDTTNGLGMHNCP